MKYVPCLSKYVSSMLVADEWVRLLSLDTKGTPKGKEKPNVCRTGSCGNSSIANYFVGKSRYDHLVHLRVGLNQSIAYSAQRHDNTLAHDNDTHKTITCVTRMSMHRARDKKKNMQSIIALVAPERKTRHNKN